MIVIIAAPGSTWLIICGHTSISKRANASALSPSLLKRTTEGIAAWVSTRWRWKVVTSRPTWQQLILQTTGCKFERPADIVRLKRGIFLPQFVPVGIKRDRFAPSGLGFLLPPTRLRPYSRVTVRKIAVLLTVRKIAVDKSDPVESNLSSRGGCEKNDPCAGFCSRHKDQAENQSPKRVFTII